MTVKYSRMIALKNEHIDELLNILCALDEVEKIFPTY